MDCASDLHNNPIRQLETSSHAVGQEKMLESLATCLSLGSKRWTSGLALLDKAIFQLFGLRTPLHSNVLEGAKWFLYR